MTYRPCRGFPFEGFPVLEERVDCDDHTDVRAVGRAEPGIGVSMTRHSSQGDPDFSGGMQEDVRLRFAGEGTIIEDDFVRIEPTIKRKGVEIEVNIFFDGRGGDRQRQLALLQIVQHFGQAVRQYEVPVCSGRVYGNALPSPKKVSALLRPSSQGIQNDAGFCRSLGRVRLSESLFL